jgi:formate hydrogenlyase subunit 6/NADH:ubiquinone oxidoreductase subunit I
MAYQIDTNICVGCGSCAEGCPVSAIEPNDDKYAINTDVCISCGSCKSVCPVDAISQE